MSDISKELHTVQLIPPLADGQEQAFPQGLGLGVNFVTPAAAESVWREEVKKRGQSASRLYEEELSQLLPLTSLTSPSILSRIEEDPENFWSLISGPTGKTLNITPIRNGDLLTGLLVKCEGLFLARLMLDLKPEEKDTRPDESYIRFSPHVLAITVLAFDEERNVSPRFAVFRALSANAMTASHYYTTTYPPCQALRQLLLWLASLNNLFNQPCKGCKELMSYDSEYHLFLPPTWRTLHQHEPYHLRCLFSGSTM
jgi:hypothetical protein